MAGVVIISKKMKTENVLPEDLILETLTRLPVRSLLRFKCVCKTWHSVISQPQFQHLRRPCVLISENSNLFSTITIESLVKNKNMAPTPLSLPWETQADDQNQVLGTCNGLVCIDLKSETSPERSGLILWNPSTRRFSRLPRPSGYQILDFFFTYVWFGYDESVDDYKLVWLSCNRCNFNQLDVLTLKSNTWRRIPTHHIDLLRTGFFKQTDKANPKSIGFFSNGAIHWGVRRVRPSARSFLAFDLAAEKFQLIKFPHTTYRLPVHTWVGSVRGCLCLSTRFDEETDFCAGVTLWMMKEYGVESSWTKVRSIPYEFTRRGFPFFKFCPIIFSEKEEGKEMECMFEYVCARFWDNGRGENVKFRIGGGGENVRFEETLVVLGNRSMGEEGQIPVVLPMMEMNLVYQDTVVELMEESLESPTLLLQI